MTQKQLIELIQQHHPIMGETEIRLALNRAQDDFCAKTELIKETYTLKLKKYVYMLYLKQQILQLI